MMGTDEMTAVHLATRLADRAAKLGLDRFCDAMANGPDYELAGQIIDKELEDDSGSRIKELIMVRVMLDQIMELAP